MNVDISKYENVVVENLDKENLLKIVTFLTQNDCDYIDELLEDYLDIFTIDYDEFIDKYNKLNAKYNNNLINEIKEDMNILEQFYEI